jgi:flagellar hook-basal body complex protein FliE
MSLAILPHDPSTAPSIGEGRLRETPALPSSDGAAGVERNASGATFADVFGGLVGEVSQSAHIADKKAADLAAGVTDDIHGTMIAGKEAEIGVKLVSTIRNKVLDAFHELWRTSV